MCGISGIFDFKNGREVNINCLKAMAYMIRHRGPDGIGYKILDSIGLAHTRLSIIDLKTGDQPIHNENQSVWTIFNGEIFNYIELRDELISKGHVFYTKSDTEIIVHLYEEYGDKFVNQLNGQFAISLYDARNRRLLLIRDRIGIAPLFYTQEDSKLLFASEVKSLLAALNRAPSINYTALDQIFTFWSPVSPETIFENVYEVSPGHMLIVENASIKNVKYWDWEFPVNGNYTIGNDDLLAEELKELLIDATRIRLRSDVPVGAYLSGGLDSSSIVSLINNYTHNSLRTFSIGFDDNDFDETNHQSKLVEMYNTKHSYIKCSNTDIADSFVDTIWHTETPILRTAPVPMKKLSALVKDNNYKVVLTGEGADEVLGGYDIFKETKLRLFWSKFPDSRIRPTLLKRLYPYLDLSRGDAYIKAFFGRGLDHPELIQFSHLTRWSSTEKCKDFFSEETRSHITINSEDTILKSFPNDIVNWGNFNRAQYIEAKSLMSGYLLCSQGDRMLMSNSIEGRFPFLDHRVIEFSNKLHPKYKMKVLNEKYLLKKAMQNDLPNEIISRYKQPYRAPNIPAFFSNRKNEYIMTLLSKDSINKYGYFDAMKVERLIKKILNGNAIGNKDDMAFVGILSTQIWHHLFIDNHKNNCWSPNMQ